MKILGVLIVIIFGCIIYYYNKSERIVSNAERHSSIPIEAIWYGGADGGVWAVIKQNDTLNNFNVLVFNEFDGSLLESGVYKINQNCFDMVLNVKNLQELIIGFDGTSFILSNERNGRNCILAFVRASS